MASLRSRIALSYAALIAAAVILTGFGMLHALPIGGVPLVAGIGSVAIFAGVALAFLLAHAVTRSLGQLTDAVGALVLGSSPPALDLGGGAEVGALATAFGEAAARLQDATVTREEEHSRLEALLAASADALVALDADGAIRYLNRAALALFGDVTGRQLMEVARSPELTALLRAALATRADQEADVGRTDGLTELVYLDGRDMWLQTTASPIAGGGGWALLVALRDVTEIRRLESTRRDFVANVSHELRTPLAGIKAVVETLRDGALDDREAADDFLVQVDREVDRLVQLVEELLQLARIESGAAVEMSTIASAELLDDCVHRFRAQADRAGVELRLVQPESLPSIWGNPSQLSQALGNLVHNALKFTPAGGEVTVTGEDLGGRLRIVVADTGTGIDPADLPRVFERFYVADRARRGGGGTGLGLAIVKHVVRVHQGTVEAQSQLGRGATFTILLPAEDR
jgi:two-component system phosphate regulon sensor histidine kinase PhoR